jgi:hypothetical protein
MRTIGIIRAVITRTLAGLAGNALHAVEREICPIRGIYVAELPSSVA